MKKISFLLYLVFLILGCSTVGVQDISSSENNPNKNNSGENISSDASKVPLNKEEETDLSTHRSEELPSTDQKKTPHFYTATTGDASEVECWNCKGGTVKLFTCQAQSFNTEDLPPGVGYYCKIGRLCRYNDKSRNKEEAEEDLGLCPQCLGTRQSKCWICNGKGRFIPK
ncbi:MAG: hypothetical protein AABZ60_24700 [Planctomycetota bacterium]